jgi:hypothetical protein
MRRVALVLIVLVLAAASVLGVYAQPGGGAPNVPVTVTPTPRPSFPSFPPTQSITEVGEIEQLLRELGDALDTELAGPLAELRPVVQENLPSARVALEGNLLKAAALIMGVLLLGFVQRFKGVALVTVGVMIGLLVSQLPLAADLTRDLARELPFMANPVGQTIGFGLIGAVGGLILLTPLTFMTLAGAGALAGALLGVQFIGGNDPEFSVGIGALVGFMAMSWAISRGWVLLALAVGGGLMVFALRLQPGWIPLFMLTGVLSLQLRDRDKRIAMRPKPLQELDLKDGKVDIRKMNKSARPEQTKIAPEMHDDSSNSPIRPL